MIMPNSPKTSWLIANNHIICSWWLITIIHMKCPTQTCLFLEIELLEWKCHKHHPNFSYSKFTTHCTSGGYIIVICFDEWIWGIYVSRMMLLLAPVSASTLSRCSSWLTMILIILYQLTQCLFIGWDEFSSLVLLELNDLQEVNKYSFLSPSSLTTY
jgi:hypothetical protein